MAQRTAFLNSDAKGYNKDFHHTWIHNYLLHQVGVMFTDYNVKNEFKLGNGQISGGKAIIRCTRTTGNFAGSKILALFESTATESISTSGDKKVFIEIPEIYVNDSTAITDTLTQGLNLGVGVIKSEADYPSHTNYIPLWEITGGDWEQAVDVRPEILARGKPNTISYTDNNGVQRNMMLDASSLNKFLKSNGAGVAPSWADVGDVVEVSNLKNTFFAGEDLLPKSMFRMESELDTVDAVDESIRFGYDTDSAKVQLNTILSGEEGDYVKLNLEGFNTPADNVNVRIETVDSSGNATGTLINPDATATINPSGTLEEMSINLAGMIDGTTAGQEVAVVLSRSGALSTSNYYKVGVATADTGIWKVKTFDGTSWNLETGKKGYISSPLFMEEGAIQSKATTEFLAETTGYVEAGATAGNEFTGVRFGMIEYDGFKPGDKVFLTDTGELSNISGTIQKQIGSGVKTDVVEISSIWIGGGGGVMTYDAVVAADGSGDYMSITDAISASKKSIYVKDGTYTMSSQTLSTGDFKLVGESRSGVVINITYGTRSGTIFTLTSDTVSKANSFLFSNLTFNISYTGAYGYFIMFGGMGAGTGFLKVFNCNINVTQAINGCNFYITGGSNNDTLIEGCRIEVYLATGSFTGVGFLGISRRSTCINSTIVVDASASLAQSITFEGCPDGTYIGCRFLIGVDHKKSGDIAYLGSSRGLMCNYDSSSYCNLRIGGTQENCTFPGGQKDANYDTALNTAIANKSITIWKPSTSYSVGQYVQSGRGTGLAKCITAHTSGTEYDTTKFEEVYGDVFISGTLKNCTLAVWGTVILSGIAQYVKTIVVPAVMGNFESTTFTFTKNSSSLPDYCNIVVLGYKGFNNNGILGHGFAPVHVYLGGEGSTFMGNRIVAYTGDIYSGGYGNIIVGNVFTYVTGQNAPTITQVTSGQSEIANNVIRGVADWTD